MKTYLKAINELNQVAIQVNGKDELKRFSLSDTRWCQDRNAGRRKWTIKKGEVYQFEFGKNFVPEMSYEHRGLVIGVNKKMLYVLPIFSYDGSKKDHKEAVHYTDNPNSKSDLYLLKASENSFITRDSVLKLNDLRSISINRILYQQNQGRMDITSDTYKMIESLVLRKYFQQHCFEYECMKKSLEEEQSKNIALQQHIDELTKELAILKANQSIQISPNQTS